MDEQLQMKTAFWFQKCVNSMLKSNSEVTRLFAYIALDAFSAEECDLLDDLSDSYLDYLSDKAKIMLEMEEENER